MQDIDRKTDLLRKRVAALSIPQDVMEAVAKEIAQAGLTFSGAAEQLRREWLNDILASPDASLFRAASLDPSAHFSAWAVRRAKDRFHVSWRAVEQIARQLGAEAANRLVMVIWPQEIAWAQRLRLAENPHMATRAAMFLREAEGNPARMFVRLAEIYGDSFTKHEYSGSPVHDIAPSEIRMGDSLPEFTPLFVRYAARAYSDKLNVMPRDKLEVLATRARRDEMQERARIASSSSAAAARRFPMRRVLHVIAAAHRQKLSPNQLYLCEEVFLERVEKGEVEIDPQSRTPQTEFLMALTDPEERKALLSSSEPPELDPVALQWEIANLDRSWIAALPETYRKWASSLNSSLSAWQAAVIEGGRELPFDLVSDFGTFLYEKENA